MDGWNLSQMSWLVYNIYNSLLCCSQLYCSLHQLRWNRTMALCLAFSFLISLLYLPAGISCVLAALSGKLAVIDEKRFELSCRSTWDASVRDSLYLLLRNVICMDSSVYRGGTDRRTHQDRKMQTQSTTATGTVATLFSLVSLKITTL